MRSKKKAKKAARPRLYGHDTSRTVATPDRVLAAFTACMKEGDHEAALEILAASLRHLNKAKLARRYNIPRRTAYNLLQKRSMPGLDLIAKVCHAIDSEFTSSRTSRLSSTPTSRC
ncbi:MAG: hypothetical protein ABII00_16190 [Elusimicrobiota bacterium]